MRVFNPLRRQAHTYHSIPPHRQVRYFEGSKHPGRCRGFGLHGLRVCVLEESTRRKRVQGHRGINSDRLDEHRDGLPPGVRPGRDRLCRERVLSACVPECRRTRRTHRTRHPSDRRGEAASLEQTRHVERKPCSVQRPSPPVRFSDGKHRALPRLVDGPSWACKGPQAANAKPCRASVRLPALGHLR